MVLCFESVVPNVVIRVIKIEWLGLWILELLTAAIFRMIASASSPDKVYFSYFG